MIIVVVIMISTEAESVTPEVNIHCNLINVTIVMQKLTILRRDTA